MGEGLSNERRALSRRTFLKASALVAAGLGLNLQTNQLLADEPAEEGAAGEDGEGTWIPASCWEVCGGRCVNKALVKDGIVLRQKTDDSHDDSPDYLQMRGCLRGRSLRKEVFAADRLKYPMKRKHWEPFTGGDKSLRGVDEWERISWEEALDYIAAEIQHARDNYGSNSILTTTMPANTDIQKMLFATGGCTVNWGTNSYGAWTKTPFVIGYGWWNETINDRMDWRNCDTIVLLGSNPAWASPISIYYNYLPAKEAGAKFICVDPYYNDTASLLDAEWIPIRPATDMAFLLGVAYVLITEDNPDSNPLIDWDMLNRCTLGFDADHMPEGEDPEGNFKDYVLGTYDGVPKTPEWASEICGATPDQIHYFAYEIRPEKNVAITSAWAPARTNQADSLPQMMMTIGSMTGHIGKPGNMTGVSALQHAGNGGTALVSAGSNGLPSVQNPVDDAICNTDLWTAVLNGKYLYSGNGGSSFKVYLPGEERDIDIHVIYQTYSATLQTQAGLPLGIEAHRKVDFVVSQGFFPQANNLYADIVLPVSTQWEREGGFNAGNREFIQCYKKVVEPLYETHTDQWIAIELGKRLGMNVEEVYPISEKQQFFNQILGATVVCENGVDFEPLVTVTEEDIEQWGVEGTPQQGRITIQELFDRGGYQVQRTPGDSLGYIAFQAFVEDPENNPTTTSESGKFEIYSRALADMVNQIGRSEIKPIPTYIPPVEGYEGTFADWDNKVKGDCPFQRITPHYMRRAHTVFDNIGQLREAFSSNVYLNAEDAAELGIESGDTALVTNANGKVARRVTVTERLMPGVVIQPHGGWQDVDDETGIDFGGSDNTLTSPQSFGSGVSGYNTCLVNVEKWTGEPLPADVDRPVLVLEGE